MLNIGASVRGMAGSEKPPKIGAPCAHIAGARLIEFADMHLRETGTPEAGNEQAGLPPCHGEGGKVVTLSLGLLEHADRRSRRPGTSRIPTTAGPKQLVALSAASTPPRPFQDVGGAGGRSSEAPPGKGTKRGRLRDGRQGLPHR
jgi:hypothetical protein